jgi:hypothetical protein
MRETSASKPLSNEARTLYLQYRGTKNVEGEKSWDTSVLQDFAELRQSGLSHTLMDQIEKQFGGGSRRRSSR